MKLIWTLLTCLLLFNCSTKSSINNNLKKVTLVGPGDNMDYLNGTIDFNDLLMDYIKTDNKLKLVQLERENMRCRGLFRSIEKPDSSLLLTYTDYLIFPNVTTNEYFKQKIDTTFWSYEIISIDTRTLQKKILVSGNNFETYKKAETNFKSKIDLLFQKLKSN